MSHQDLRNLPMGFHGKWRHPFLYCDMVIMFVKAIIEIYTLNSIRGEVQHFVPYDENVAMTFLCSGKIDQEIV